MSEQSETPSDTSVRPPISEVTNNHPAPTAATAKKSKPWHTSFPPERRGHVVKKM